MNKTLSKERTNLSGRFHSESLTRLTKTKLPHRMKKLLESIWFHSQDYQGKGDVWWQLIDLLEENIIVVDEQ